MRADLQELVAELERATAAFVAAAQKNERMMDRVLAKLKEELSRERECPAEPRPGWEMPARKCSKCGADLAPVAVDTGDGCYLAWDECENCCGAAEDLEAYIEWPFVQGWASVGDLQRLGFRIE